MEVKIPGKHADRDTRRDKGREVVGEGRTTIFSKLIFISNIQPIHSEYNYFRQTMVSSVEVHEQALALTSAR